MAEQQLHTTTELDEVFASIFDEQRELLSAENNVHIIANDKTALISRDVQMQHLQSAYDAANRDRTYSGLPAEEKKRLVVERYLDSAAHASTWTVVEKSIQAVEHGYFSSVHVDTLRSLNLTPERDALIAPLRDYSWDRLVDNFTTRGSKTAGYARLVEAVENPNDKLRASLLGAVKAAGKVDNDAEVSPQDIEPVQELTNEVVRTIKTTRQTPNPKDAQVLQQVALGIHERFEKSGYAAKGEAYRQILEALGGKIVPAEESRSEAAQILATNEASPAAPMSQKHRNNTEVIPGRRRKFASKLVLAATALGIAAPAANAVANPIVPANHAKALPKPVTPPAPSSTKDAAPTAPVVISVPGSNQEKTPAAASEPTVPIGNTAPTKQPAATVPVSTETSPPNTGNTPVVPVAGTAKPAVTPGTGQTAPSKDIQTAQGNTAPTLPGAVPVGGQSIGETPNTPVVVTPGDNSIGQATASGTEVVPVLGTDTDGHTSNDLSLPNNSLTQQSKAAATDFIVQHGTNTQAAKAIVGETSTPAMPDSDFKRAIQQIVHNMDETTHGAPDPNAIKAAVLVEKPTADVPTIVPINEAGLATKVGTKLYGAPDQLGGLEGAGNYSAATKTAILDSLGAATLALSTKAELAQLAAAVTPESKIPAPAPEHNGGPKAPEHLSDRQMNLQAAQMMIEAGGEWKNRGIALRYFINKGVNPIGSDGFVSNFMVESGVNPSRVQDGFEGAPYSPVMPESVKWGKGAYGIGGYTASERQHDLINFQASDPQHRPINDLSLQLDFVWHELQKSEYAGVLDQLQHAQTPEEAASIVMNGYESPGMPNESARRSAARLLFNQFQTNLNKIKADQHAAQEQYKHAKAKYDQAQRQKAHPSPHNRPGPARNPSGIDAVDFSFDRVSGADLQSRGIKLASRYLSHDPKKNLSAAEAHDLLSHNVSILLNWESYQARALEGYNAGLEDGHYAATLAHQIGTPYGKAIYFSVDTDVNQTQFPALAEYFKGVREGLAKRYMVGVYGEADLIDYLHDNGYSSSEWQSLAWSHGRISPQADLYQYLNGQKIKQSWVDYDRIIHSDQLNAWQPAAPAAPHETAHKRHERFVHEQVNKMIHTAVRYAKTTTDPNDHSPNPAYLHARRAMFPGGSDSPWNEADTDCSVFAKTVVNNSIDAHWQGNSGGAIKYARESKQWTIYDVHSVPGGIKPGDILANSQHIFIYVGKQANGFSVAEASWDEGNGGHVPEIDSNLYTSQGGEAFTIIRYTG